MKLKQLRKQSDISQNELAKVIRVDTKTICNYEKGFTEPNIESLIKLANYFNVSLDYLCERQYNNQIGYIPEEKKEVIKLILLLNNENTFKTFGFVSGLLAEQK